MPDEHGYEWVKAVVSFGGKLRFRYRVKDADKDGSEGWDEDVSDWTDRNIQDLGASLLGVPWGFVKVEHR